MGNGNIGRDEYIRNIKVLDWSDSSGDVIARTCLATLADDLVFLFDATPDDKDCPKVYGTCLKLADAYGKGEPCGEYEAFLGIELQKE